MSYLATKQKFDKVCERCATKESEFFCSQCQPLKNFCGSCDVNVHSLITKKAHQRTKLNDNKEQFNINTETATTNYMTSSKMDFRENKFTTQQRVNSPSRSRSSKRRQIERERYASPENHFTSGYFNKQNFNPTNLGEMYQKFPVSTSNYLNSPVSNIHHTCRDKTPIKSSNGHFSKQYVQELKAIFDKEKEELIHKNVAINNNLERLKSTLNDQVYLLQKELTDAKVKANNEILRINEEKEHTIRRIQEISNDKEKKQNEIIHQLNQEVSALNEHLKALEDRNSKNSSNQDQRIRELEGQLDYKNRELINTSGSLKKQIDEMKKNFSNDIDGLVDRYENTIAKMGMDFERDLNNKADLLVRKDEKIAEIEYLINKSDKNYQDTILDKNSHIEQLKHDKFNLQKELDQLRISKNNLSLKFEMLEKSESNLRQDYGLKNRDFEYLNAENSKLKHELNLLIEKDKASCSEINKLKTLCDNYQKNSDAQINELIQLQEAYDTLKKSNSVLSTHLRSLEKNNDIIKTDINRLHKENQENYMTKEDLKSCNYNLGNSVEILKSENTRLQRELECCDLEREKLRIENINIKEEVIL